MEKFDIQFTDHIEKERSSEFKERMVNVVNACVENIGKKHVALGNGKAAEVYSRSLDSISCIKFNINNDISSNDIKEEMRFLDELYENGVSVSEPIGIAHGKFDMLIMERLEASTLEDFIKGRNRTELPKGFDVDEFFAKCRVELKKMHDLGIHHRDLHVGNIMIDKDGNPIFIDFGDAKKKFLSEEDVYKDDTIRGITRYISDVDRLRQNKIDFKKYLSNLNKDLDK